MQTPIEFAKMSNIEKVRPSCMNSCNASIIMPNNTLIMSVIAYLLLLCKPLITNTESTKYKAK